MDRYAHLDMPRDTSRGNGGIRAGLTRRAFLLGGTMLCLHGCTTVPITGRYQFMLISHEQELALGRAGV